MRISTNAIMRNYRGSLGNSTNRLSKSRERVLTERQFVKASEDPASATKAFQLRREYLKNEDYIHNLGVAQGEISAAESSLMQINDMAKQVKEGLLRGITGTMGLESRNALAQNIEELSNSMVMSMNAKFGDKFIFGGSSTKEAPFELKTDAAGNKTLTYRGEDVITGDFTDLLKETNYIDLGFGLKKDASGNIIKGTAYETSRPGIEILGNGETVDGISKNIIMLGFQIADELRKQPVDEARLVKMSTQFDINFNKNIDKVTQYGTNSKFLEDTETRLIDSRLNLNKKIVDTENVDLAQAITEFSWAEFAYNAALKVGNSILSQSFIDFMR